MTAMILLSEWQRSQVEFWRKIPGYEGYDVSSFGRVRSWRTVTRPHGTPGGTIRARRKTPKVMRQHPKKDGYLTASIRTADVDRIRKITTHRLVALAFLPNPDNLPDVNHKTGCKDDNRLDNLEWKSEIGNAHHAWDNGLYKHQKYSDDMIRSIRADYLTGMSVGNIARKFEVAHQYVSEIVNHKKRLRVA